MRFIIIISLISSCSQIVPISKTDHYNQKGTSTQTVAKEIPINNSPTYETEIETVSIEDEPMPQTQRVITVQSDGSFQEEVHNLPAPKIFYPNEKKQSSDLKIELSKKATLSETEKEIALENIKTGQIVDNTEEETLTQNQSVDLSSEEENLTVDPSQIAAEPEPTQVAGSQFNFNSTYEKKSKWLNYFSKQTNVERLERFFNNGHRYRSFIEEIFEEHEVPKDLFFVGLIESGYQLKAKSHANAVGPWQFIRSAGKQYGLKINSLIDERRDIYKSTKAAALYFKDLYNIFGSWELALSAYNAGPYRIINLITRENTRDFAKLSKSKYFPKETSDYVPKLQAVMEIYENAESFGIKIERLGNPFDDTTLIPLKYSLSLNTLSKKLNIPKAKIQGLNPELISGHTPFFKNSSYQLRIPNAKFNESIAYKLKNLKERNPYRGLSSKYATHHKVKKGENLYAIAAKYKTSVKAIMKLNRFNNSRIYIGQKLRIPENNRTVYTVRKGDNLTTISKKFGKKLSELSKLNNLKKFKIFPGQKLIVK